MGTDTKARKIIGQVGRGVILGLKALGIYMWPFAARWKHPFSWLGFKKKLIRTLRGTAAFIGVVLAHQFVHAGTSRAFPTGEEELESRGIDPAIARELSDATIRVRHRDFLGTAHYFNDFPTILGPLAGLAFQGMPDNAYAIPNDYREDDENVFKSYLSGCLVLLQDESVTSRDFISLLTGIPKNRIENLPLSDRESFDAVTFHEFAHCHSENRKAAPLAEADADVRGAFRAAAVHGNPEIPKAVLYGRAMTRGANGHDTSLYLDAALNGLPLPQDGPTLLQATRDAFTLAALYNRNVLHNSNPEKEDALILDQKIIEEQSWQKIMQTYDALRLVLRDEQKLLTPESRRRAELYIEAVEYFSPRAALRWRLMHPLLAANSSPAP